MKINLRKASALQSVIRSAISERANLISGRMSMPLWNASDEALAQERNKQLTVLSDVERLEDLLSNLRDQVGKANVKAGISTLLSEQVKLTAQISRLSKLTARAEVMPSTDVLERQVVALKAASEKELMYRGDTLTVGCLSSKDLDRLKANLIKCRRRQVEINDKLIAANLSSEVSVSDNDWAWLEDQGLV